MSTSLTEIMRKHGTDKASDHHNYSQYYSALFDPIREEKLNLLEIGIGTMNPNIPSSMIGTPWKYVPGSSLRAWEEYFPNANIYGCDIDKDILFQKGRISTFYVDQTNPDSIREKICETPITFDIIIDDGLHHFPTNWAMLKQIFSKLNPGGIYVIEDILNFDSKILEEDFVRENKGTFDYIKIPNPKNTADNNVLVVRKSVQRDLVIITSAINVPKPERSVFHVQDRFSQTLKTISSVRKHLPNSLIYLVEVSELALDMLSDLREKCDLVLICGKDERTQYYSRIAKSFGEVCMLQIAIEKIPDCVNVIYKLSGRYYLSDDFKVENMRRDKYNFLCTYAEANATNVYQTTFYSFPKTKLEDYKRALGDTIEMMYAHSMDIERALYETIRGEDVNRVEKLGCKGWYSVNGREYEC